MKTDVGNRVEILVGIWSGIRDIECWANKDLSIALEEAGLSRDAVVKHGQSFVNKVKNCYEVDDDP